MNVLDVTLPFTPSSPDESDSSTDTNDSGVNNKLFDGSINVFSIDNHHPEIKLVDLHHPFKNHLISSSIKETKILSNEENQISIQNKKPTFRFYIYMYFTQLQTIT